MSKQEYCSHFFSEGTWVGIIIMLLITLIVLAHIADTRIQELGQAICEEEYNMDYKSYNNEELKCKPKEIKHEKQYDGITIQVGGGE
ncbi:hypothetical protein LCGC14_2480000 [marine sediment metagenome]|uniref:Uncharacterized protein n=1 Tax=marine sediment metagenome TaxID=412755 RepID=A0A0F9DJX8_9ZZZZ